MRELEFDFNDLSFLKTGDTIIKANGAKFAVYVSEVFSHYAKPVIRKHIKLREITGINGVNLDVSIKS